MKLRKQVEKNQKKVFLKKFVCGMTAATILFPLGISYAANDAEKYGLTDETDKPFSTASKDAAPVDMAGETSMFDRVPANSWIYNSINKLIATGKVPRYKNQIKPGATFTRFELALITYYGIREMKFMTPEEKDILKPLEEEFRYDLEKVSLMHRLSELDADKPIDEQADLYKQSTIYELSPNVEGIAKVGVPVQLPGKKPVLDDKLSIWGFARLRFQRNDYSFGK